MIRDDIFTSKDRTKFFDYIIPIIPVIDSSNSYVMLLDLLEESPINYNLDKGFLQKISLYIDDMRLLINICNEFAVYIKKLDTTELNHNKMMAIITYKNLFPRDFSDLQLARGFVHELFTHKSKLTCEALESLENQKRKLSDRIEKIKNEVLTSQEELDDAYTAKNNRLSSRVNRTIGQAEYDATIIQNKNEKDKRKQAIQDKLDNKLPELVEKLGVIEHEITLIHSRSLRELITRENINDVFSLCHENEVGEISDFNDVKRSEYFDLLKFLIRNGYIDETYNDYMSYFYPGSIGANDKIFLRRITDRRGSDYTYVLKNPKAIIESPVLGVADFEQDEVLNFDLFTYLLKNNDNPKNAKYLQTIISRIRRIGNYDFVSKFYASDNICEQFVSTINKQWPDFFANVLHGNYIPLDLIKRFSVETFYYSDLSDIEKVNSDNCLTEYISQCPDYLDIEQPNIDKLTSGFMAIGVSFENVDYELSNEELFDKVYENNLYVINFKNIRVMLEEKYGIESDLDIIHKNYSLICSKKGSPLYNYISENMSKYLEVVLDNCEENISDDENFAIDILNHQEIESPLKIRYIDSLRTKISDITQIESNQLWKSLMERKIICYSAENCLSYFDALGFDSYLVEYINDYSAEIDFTNVLVNFRDEIVRSFSDTIVMYNDIDTNKYQKILLDLKYAIDEFDVKSINDDKITVLIENGIIQMNTGNMEFMRENYSQSIYQFIQHNFNSYLELQDEIFNLEEILPIIEWDIEDEQKLALLKFAEKPISIVGKNYSDTVMEYITTNNFVQSEMPVLFKNYSGYGAKTQNAICELATNNPERIIYHKFVLDDNLLSILLKNESVSRDHKLNLFEISLSEMNPEKCRLHLDELGLGEISGIFLRNSGRRKYDKNAETTAVFEILKSYGWIADYRIDEKNPEKYVVVTNKN